MLEVRLKFDHKQTYEVQWGDENNVVLLFKDSSYGGRVERTSNVEVRVKDGWMDFVTAMKHGRIKRGPEGFVVA